MVGPPQRFAGNPDWPARLTAGSRVGFKNVSGTDCYKIVTFQMLLHWPGLMNWLDYYADQHRESQAPCKMGAGATPCKLCRLRDLYDSYWYGFGNRAFIFKILIEEINKDWIVENKRGQQDVAEYWTEVYRQVRYDTVDIFKKDLVALVQPLTVTHRECKGGDGACKGEWLPNEHVMLHLQFPQRLRLGKEAGAPEDKTPELRESIHQFFAQSDLPAGTKCKTCHNIRVDHEYIAQAPEVLVLHLNRAQYNLEKLEPVKVNTPIVFAEMLELPGSYFDPRIIDPQENVYYELTTVIMHKGDTINVGHYTIYAKGPSGKWVLNDDQMIFRCKTFDEWAKKEHNQSCAYIFSYRRVEVDKETQKIIDTKNPTKAAKMKTVDQAIQTDDLNSGLEPGEKEGFQSSFGLNWIPVSGDSVYLKGQLKTNDNMEGIEFPEGAGHLELTWKNKNGNKTNHITLKGTLTNGNDLEAAEPEKEGKGSRVKGHLSSAERSGSGSGSSKSVKSKESGRKPGAGPRGVVKRRSAGKAALEGLKRALGRGGKEEKEGKEKKKGKEENKKKRKGNEKEKKREKKKG
ncbi:hypothetical protein N7507_011520 [Penicillium longicatenatum]|nr:hypothetical protein N7507_011520 [Penicillium longicatenatum]